MKRGWSLVIIFAVFTVVALVGLGLGIWLAVTARQSVNASTIPPDSVVINNGKGVIPVSNFTGNYVNSAYGYLRDYNGVLGYTSTPQNRWTYTNGVWLCVDTGRALLRSDDGVVLSTPIEAAVDYNWVWDGSGWLLSASSALPPAIQFLTLGVGGAGLSTVSRVDALPVTSKLFIVPVVE